MAAPCLPYINLSYLFVKPPYVTWEWRMPSVLISVRTTISWVIYIPCLLNEKMLDYPINFIFHCWKTLFNFFYFFLSVILSSLFHILCVSSTFIHISRVKIYKTETIPKAKKILFNEWSLKILEDFLIKTKNVRMFLGKREWSKWTLLLYFTMFKNNFANNHAQKVTY